MQIRKASVRLVYVVAEGEVDGLSGGEELTFERTVHLTSLTTATSECSVNGNVVSYDQYIRGLLEINIDVKAKNFLVFQGEISSLSRSNPKDLLRYFEVFSGSAQFKEPYEEASKALDEARRNHLVKSTNRKTALAALRELQNAQKDAERAANLNTEIMDKNVTIALLKLYHLKRRLETGEKDLESAKKELASTSAQERDMADRQKEVAQTLSRLNREISKKEAQLVKYAQTARQYGEEELSLSLQETANREKLPAQQAERTDIAAQLQRIDVRIQDLEVEVEEIEAKIRTIETAEGSRAGSAKEKVYSEDAKAEFSALQEQERQETYALQEDIQRAKRVLEGHTSEHARLESTHTTVTSHSHKLRSELDLLNTSLQRVGKDLATEEAQQQAREKELETFQASLAEAEESRRKVWDQLAEVRAEISTVQTASVRAESERRVDRAIEDMKRMFPPVRGRLVDLVRPRHKKYAVACQLALGRFADAIVVSNDAVIPDCIRLLREQRIRPQQFLPLNSLRPRDAEDALHAAVTRSQGALRFAMDCFSLSDPELEVALKFACGSVLVADTLADAMAVRYGKGSGAGGSRVSEGLSVKVVSLDGAVLARNGNMTGGTLQDGAESENRWSQAHLRSLENKRDALLQQEEVLARRCSRSDDRGASLPSLIEETANLVSVKANVIASLRLERAMLQNQQSTLTKELETLDKQSEELRKKLQNSDAAVKLATEQVANLEATRDSISDRVFAPFLQKHGLSSIKEYREEQTSASVAISGQRSTLAIAKERLKSILSYEVKRRDALMTRMREVEAELGNLQEELEHNKSKIAALKAKASKHNEVLQNLRKEVEELVASKTEVEASREELTEQKRQIQESRSPLIRAVAVKEGELERLRVLRHDLLLQCHVDDIELPQKGARGNQSGKPGPRRSRRHTDASDSEESDGSYDSQHEATDEDDPMDGTSRPKSDTSSSASTQSTAVPSGGDPDQSQSRHFSQASDSLVQADAQKVNTIDFSVLSSADRKLDARELEHRIRGLEDEVAHLRRVQSEIPVTRNVEERLAQAEAQVATLQKEVEASRKEVSEKEENFSRIKRKRMRLLRHTFDKCAQNINALYKELTRSKIHPGGGSATLMLLHEEELFNPSLGGITYNPSVPGKQYFDIGGQSGGEQTIASLALLFALQMVSPSPFFILDEVDAALDPVNVQKVSRFIQSRSKKGTQFIVISLKESFFANAAQSLVGVYKDLSSGTSHLLTLDLTKYEANAPPVPTSSRALGSIRSGSVAGSSYTKDTDRESVLTSA